jgi:MazG family protein
MPDPRPTTPAPLTDVMRALQLAPHQLQLFDPAYPRFDAQRPLLVLRPQFETARPLLARRYPATAQARAARGEHTTEAPLADLPADAAAWLLPAIPPEDDVRSLAGLRGILERLFGPDGCPWDREQTPASLATFFIEETYELVDAIEHGDPSEVREELGDVLAHVFMQTSVAQLEGQFTVEDVVEHIARKLVRRHPHVYGAVQTDDPAEIERLWEQIKADERAERGDPARPESALDSVPASAPALVRADRLIGRAERAGLGPSPGDPRRDLEAATHALGDAPNEAALGALLWAAVRLARDAGIDAEQALRLTAATFVERFRTAEDEARAAGTALAALPSDRRAAVWTGLAAAEKAQ